MKHIISFLILIFSVSLSGQSKEHFGEYKLESGGENHLIENKLTLNQDGTFLFHHYDNILNGIPPERNFYGKGTWTSNKRIIIFKVEDSDVDASHVLNFNNSKARFDTKSPRDKSNSDIKTSIRFYESDIFWMTGRTLLKQ